MKKRTVFALFAMLLVGNVYGMEEGCPPDELDYVPGSLDRVSDDSCGEIFSFIPLRECCQSVQLANKEFCNLFRNRNRVVDVEISIGNGVMIDGYCCSLLEVESLCSLLENTSNYSANVTLSQELGRGRPYQPDFSKRIIASFEKIKTLDISGAVSSEVLEAASEKKPEFLKFTFGSFSLDTEKFKVLEKCTSICGITVEFRNLEKLMNEENVETVEQFLNFVNNFDRPVSIVFCCAYPLNDIDDSEERLGSFSSRIKNLKSFTLHSSSQICSMYGKYFDGKFLKGLPGELEVLDLYSCIHLNEDYLCDCLEKLTKLKKLRLVQMPIEGKICSKLPASIEELILWPYHQLENEHCNLFVFESLKNCFERLPNLKKLTMERFDLENRPFWCYLPEGITELTVQDCENFDFDGFIKNVFVLPHLRRLYLSNVGRYCGKNAIGKLRALRDDQGVSVCLAEELFYDMCKGSPFLSGPFDKIEEDCFREEFGDDYNEFYDKCYGIFSTRTNFLFTIEEVERIYDVARRNGVGYEFSEEEKIVRRINVLRAKIEDFICNEKDSTNEDRVIGNLEYEIAELQRMLQEKKR